MKEIKNKITVAITLLLIPFSALFVLWVATEIGVDLRELQGASFKLSPKNLFIAYLFVGLQFLIIFIAHKLILKKPFKSLGFKAKKGVSLLFMGTFIALFIKAIIYLGYIGSASDFSINWSVPGNIGPGEMIAYYVYYLIFLLTLNSLTEEVVYRAFPLENLWDKKSNYFLTVLLVAILFAAVHHLLEPFSWSVFTTRVLFGTLAGILYCQHRSIWLPVGLHNGWNWVSTSFTGNWKCGGIFDLEVSNDLLSLTTISNTILFLAILYFFYKLKSRQAVRRGTIS